MIYPPQIISFVNTNTPDTGNDHDLLSKLAFKPKLQDSVVLIDVIETYSEAHAMSRVAKRDVDVGTASAVVLVVLIPFALHEL